MGIEITGVVDDATLSTMEECAQKGMRYNDIMSKKGRELPVINKDDYTVNGRIEKNCKMVVLPTAEGKPGLLPEKTAVAWAYLVQDAAKDPKVNVNRLRLTGPNSGYRLYDVQVEFKAKYGKNAATPGRSPHGWGLAIDFALTNKGSGGVRAGSYEAEWLEKNASRFGFYPYLAKKGRKRFDDGSYRYEENWHWTFDPNFHIQ